MKDIEPTDAERLILANQYKILSILEEDEGLADLANNLLDGYQWLYQDRLRVSPIMRDEEVQYVLSILDLYGLLKSSLAELKDPTDIHPNLVVFPGFDGNNESELLHFTGALYRSGRYTEEIGNPAKNSHGSTGDLYSRMLGEWRRLGEPTYPLSENEIKAILAAPRTR